MKIKNIKIINVKGIANRTFDLNLIPNKPNILVAPNGFGKSSFSIGFDSLKRNKIELDEKNYHLNDSNNKPVIEMTIEDISGIKNLLANDTTNIISNEFDVFVINSQLMAKAKKMNISGNIIVKSSLEISPITLIKTIPSKVLFSYNVTKARQAFGTNGFILSNIISVFKSASLLHSIINEVNFSKFVQVKTSRTLSILKDEINEKTGTKKQIKSWIEEYKKAEFEDISEFNKLAKILRNFDGISTDTESYLAAFQVIETALSMKANFQKAANYVFYLDEKDYFTTSINDFIPANVQKRFDIKPKVSGSSLVIEWPKAHEISNGQRDILSFIALLMKAKRSFKKQNCILIIDEVFDYLDDANLIAFQYFVTNMIEDMKSKGKNFFPILMTHLDPLFFHNNCFNKHKLKVAYLKETPYQSSQHIINLIKKRGDSTIQQDVDKHHFHYYPTPVSIENEFVALGLPKAWGCSEKFHEFINFEVEKYLEDKKDYDPLAICFGVRVKVEELIYDQIKDSEKRQEFLDLHGTKKKLEYCEKIRHSVPDTFYLLGIIYNDELHRHKDDDNVRAVANKLENFVIKKMISGIFSKT
ncbi:ATP-binding protein [Flavobacterium litorale]|uniref:ATP-binding protein n=1 Tax=Flavobacterium litorale TaxID=2856519 RepID=A0ABX8V8I6_9FLAO|nr:ATP-binding protein [Flavobacterium litorale]QYJ69164.1 ATP-binding protein [Flavobacterium litorale]